jgi:purine-binding chemotaxis protein CheW
MTASIEISGQAKSLGTTGDVLTFKLGAEQYGISIRDVQEIRSFETPTRLPNCVPALLGVINLRGTIAPILDLRKVTGCAAPVAAETSVVVLQLGSRVLGVVVDAVCDVVHIGQEHLRLMPAVGCSSVLAIEGLATVADQLIVLLEVGPLFGLISSNEVADAVSEGLLQ